MKRVLLILGITCLVAGPRAAAEDCTKAKDPKAPPPAAQVPAKPAAGGAGLVAFVDLQTGKLVEPSAADMAAFALSLELQNAMNFSFDGLTEVPLPGGGYKVDLQGRFQSPLLATVGKDGKLQMGHPVAAPPVPTEAARDEKVRKDGVKK